MGARSGLGSAVAAILRDDRGGRISALVYGGGHQGRCSRLPPASSSVNGTHCRDALRYYIVMYIATKYTYYSCRLCGGVRRGQCDWGGGG